MSKNELLRWSEFHKARGRLYLLVDSSLCAEQLGAAPFMNKFQGRGERGPRIIRATYLRLCGAGSVTGRDCCIDFWLDSSCKLFAA